MVNCVFDFKVFAIQSVFLATLSRQNLMLQYFQAKSEDECEDDFDNSAFIISPSPPSSTQGEFTDTHFRATYKPECLNILQCPKSLLGKGSGYCSWLDLTMKISLFLISIFYILVLLRPPLEVGSVNRFPDTSKLLRFV